VVFFSSSESLLPNSYLTGGFWDGVLDADPVDWTAASFVVSGEDSSSSSAGGANSNEAPVPAEALLLFLAGVVFSDDVVVVRPNPTPPVDFRLGVLRRFVAPVAVVAVLGGVAVLLGDFTVDDLAAVAVGVDGDLAGVAPLLSCHAFARALASANASFFDLLGVGLAMPSSPPGEAALRFFGGMILFQIEIMNVTVDGL